MNNYNDNHNYYYNLSTLFQHQQVANNLYVDGGANVGPGGIKSDGPVAIDGPVSITDVLRLKPRGSPPPNAPAGTIYFGWDGHIHYYSGSAWYSLFRIPD